VQTGVRGRTLTQAERSDALKDVYWALEPLAVSQVLAPKTADRFLVQLRPEPKWILADSCKGGLHYTSRLVVVYDKVKIVVSDPLDFTLADHSFTR
jgi:hypothetical protein